MGLGHAQYEQVPSLVPDRGWLDVMDHWATP
jgi:hypothetical protein